jgi:hypothetical protein
MLNWLFELAGLQKAAVGEEWPGRRTYPRTVWSWRLEEEEFARSEENEENGEWIGESDAA